MSFFMTSRLGDICFISTNKLEFITGKTKKCFELGNKKATPF